LFVGGEGHDAEGADRVFELVFVIEGVDSVATRLVEELEVLRLREEEFLLEFGSGSRDELVEDVERSLVLGLSDDTRLLE